MTNRTLRENSTIDLLDFLWEVLLRWRVAVIFMVVFAVGTMFFMRYREDRAIAQQQEELAAMEAEIAEEEAKFEAEAEAELMEELYAPLTEAERLAVESFILQAQQLAETEDYLNNSLYMNQDADNIQYVRTKYQFHANSSFAGEIARDIQARVARELPGELKNIWDVADNYIKELFTTDSSQSFYSDLRNESRSEVTITVYITAGAKVSDVENIIATLLDKAMKSVPNAFGSFEVIRKDTNVYSNIDRDFRLKQNQAWADLASKKAALQKSVEGTTKAQQLSYYELSGAKVPTDWDSEKVKEEVEEEFAKTNEITRSSPKRNLAIGLVLGLFVYVILLFAWMVLRLRVTDSSLVKEVYGIPSLGQYRRYPYKGFSAFVHSRWIYEKRYGKDTSGTVSEIQRYMEYYRENTEGEISLILSQGVGEGSKELLSALKANVISLPQSKAERLDVISGTKGILVVPVSTRYNYFDELMADYALTDTKPIGMILVEA